MNYFDTFFVWKFKFIFMIFLNFYHEERCNVVHHPNDYLFAISIEIYHELIDDSYCLLLSTSSASLIFRNLVPTGYVSAHMCLQVPSLI